MLLQEAVVQHSPAFFLYPLTDASVSITKSNQTMLLVIVACSSHDVSAWGVWKAGKYAEYKPNLNPSTKFWLSQASLCFLALAAGHTVHNRSTLMVWVSQELSLSRGMGNRELHFSPPRSCHRGRQSHVMKRVQALP